MRLLPALLAAGTAALAAYAWTTYQQRWTPDFELYTQEGVGLYPSPLGRLLGNLGETGFAAVSAIGAGVTVWVVSSKAVGRGAVLLLSPVLLYLTFASADVIALGLYALYLYWSSSFVTAVGDDAHGHGSDPSRTPVVGLRTAGEEEASGTPHTFLRRALAALVDPIRSWAQCNETRREKQGAVCLAAGILTHFALLPYALLHLALTDRMTRTQKFVAGYFLGGTAAIVLLVTPYGGIIFVDRGFWTAAGYGLALAALVSLPALVFFQPRLIHYLAFAVGALECGLQNHAQARYFLPAILLLAATGRPRFGEVRTPSGGSYRWGLTPPPASEMVGVAPGQGAAASRSSTRRLRHIQEGTLR